MLLDTFFEQYGILIILLVAFAAIMLLYYFRNKKYRQAEADFQTQLKVGDKVKTYSGFYGTVEKLTNTTDGLVVTLRLGENAVVGACCELKNSILFNGAQVPHLSYVGDSILGENAHFGAGVIAANLRLDQRPVRVCDGGKMIETGLRKVGALVGDGAQVGCGSVLCPGTIIKRGEFVLPLSCVSGSVKKEGCNK